MPNLDAIGLSGGAVIAGLSTGEVLVQAAAAGCVVTARQFERWRYRRALPRPSGRGRGRGAGQIYLHEPDVVSMLIALERHKRAHRSLDVATVLTWLDAHHVSVDAVRGSLQRVVAAQFRPVRKAARNADASAMTFAGEVLSSAKARRTYGLLHWDAATFDRLHVFAVRLFASVLDDNAELASIDVELMATRMGLSSVALSAIRTAIPDLDAQMTTWFAQFRSVDIVVSAADDATYIIARELHQRIQAVVSMVREINAVWPTPLTELGVRLIEGIGYGTPLSFALVLTVVHTVGHELGWGSITSVEEAARAALVRARALRDNELVLPELPAVAKEATVAP